MREETDPVHAPTPPPPRACSSDPLTLATEALAELIPVLRAESLAPSGTPAQVLARDRSRGRLVDAVARLRSAARPAGAKLTLAPKPPKPEPAPTGRVNLPDLDSPGGTA